MKYSILSAFILILFSSLSQKSIEKTISIAPYLDVQNYEHFKRLTLNSPDSHIEFLQGFDFSWGYEYKLSVTEIKLSEQLSDGTQYDYSFNKIISKTKVPDSIEFRMLIDPNRYYYELDSSEQHMNQTLKQINDSTYLYFDQVELEVPEQFRATFEAIVENGVTKPAWFRFVNEKRIRVVHL